ncbi:MAG: DUF4870 domain-containing protein [Candidatus Melainabacteria bacterium]|jgi:uncharacterized membrane protein
MSDSENKTSLGLQENIAGLLTYSLGWITGIVFLLIEKENKFVRFHAIQSTIIFLPIFILNITSSVLTFAIPFLGFISLLLIPVNIIATILWVVLMIKAFQGELFKLSKIGEIAEQQLAKLDKSL